MNPLDHVCPNCCARQGAPCTQPTDTTRKPVRWFHASREALATDTKASTT